jgi:hypothetical protein
VHEPNSPTSFDGLIIPNTSGWTDAEAVRLFSAAMHREDRKIVVTPGVERPLLADANIAWRMFFQFRSFSLSSTTKMLLAGMQQRNMALFHAVQGTMFSLALGTLSYYIWARTTGGRAESEMEKADWRVWADQAVYRSGLLGIFGESQTIGSQIPAARPFLTFSQQGVAGRRADDLLSSIMGPSFGTATTAANVITGMDEPTQSTVNQARKLVPYQNVFWLKRGFDAAAGGVSSAFDLPERRSSK